MTKHTALLSACAALALLSGCSLLEPRQDPTSFFVLSPEAQADAASAAGDAEKTQIALGPVRLPDYLLRPELVRRSGPNQLEPSRVDRWAPAPRRRQRRWGRCWLPSRATPTSSWPSTC